MSDAIERARIFTSSFNEEYAAKHLAFEEQFWGTKMALKGDQYSTTLLSKTKAEMEGLLGDATKLKEAKELLSRLQNDDEVKIHKSTDDKSDILNLIDILSIIIRTCECYILPTKECEELRTLTTRKEAELEQSRNTMKLGYYDPDDDKKFVEKSSVGLRTMMRTHKDVEKRKLAYEALKSIGPFVVENGFVDIVKLRNKMAKALGKYEDFYDYKVQNAEGFSKARLFEILDDLEEKTRPLMIKARKLLCERFGEEALQPYSMGFLMAGSVVAKMDPYFPFSKSVERYARSYAAMKIDYQGATMCLDLLDRQNKYSNGFCHWPIPAWIKANGEFVPCKTNFTSLADPAAVGSGHTALVTLMHEAGHAAHFANIKQNSPLNSQERAPTSVAYAENQSMFLDSLVEDAAWMGRYAKDKDGNPIPFEIIEEKVRSTHPFAVFQLRAMLAVSYFEKALYEIPEDQLDAEKILSLAEEIESSVQGGPSPRPLMSVPHILSDEASCYYQGYTLAEMSVHQTRDYFLQEHGYITDNPAIGPKLTECYWKCGNSKNFLDIVKGLTGKELSGEAWTSALEESVDERLLRERKDYDEAIKSTISEGEINLNMKVEFKDGDILIASSSAEGGLMKACKKFEDFVSARVAQSNNT